MPKVIALYRYPVKGFTPEVCTQLTILPGGRVAGGFCRKVRFLGKIQKLGVRKSMTYRLPNSRKSNFATYMDPPALSRGFRVDQHA
jgi:hypothetical protein